MRGLPKQFISKRCSGEKLRTTGLSRELIFEIKEIPRTDSRELVQTVRIPSLGYFPFLVVLLVLNMRLAIYRLRVPMITQKRL